MTHSPDRWSGWTVTIRPTLYGTWGVWWTDAPAMESRGGYSGPCSSVEEAEEVAHRWLDHFDVTDYSITVEENPA